MTKETVTTKKRRRSNVVAKKDGKDSKEEDPYQAIALPCCPREKVMVYPGAHGRTSVKCPNCGKYILIDVDEQTAEINTACRGASKRLTPRVVHTD